MPRKLAESAENPRQVGAKRLKLKLDYELRHPHESLAWDSDHSKGIFSYQTAVARALLNHTVGERIELSTGEGGVRHVVIEKIEPHEIDLSIPA